MMMKPLLLLAVVCLVSACSPSPEIPVPNTLEVSLQTKYSHYVTLLNNACDNDTMALHNFLQIDYLTERAAFEHGNILISVLKKTGDTQFVTALKKLNSKQFKNASDYIYRGIDCQLESTVDTLFTYFPQTTNYLGLK